MKITRKLGVAALLAASLGSAAEPPRQEIGLTLGSLLENDRDTLKSGSGVAFQANYGIRIIGNTKLALFGEVHLLASPLRDVTSTVDAATRDYASLFITPGIRVKFLQASRVQPYALVGGGYALYEHSTTTLSGQPNPAPRTINRGALMYGGGVDVPLYKFVGARFEIRDFYTGNPVYNVTVAESGQHNVVIGGGFTLSF